MLVMVTFQVSKTVQLDTSGTNVVRNQLDGIANDNFAFPSSDTEVYHVFRDYDPLLREVDPQQIDLDQNVQSESKRVVDNVAPLIQD